MIQEFKSTKHMGQRMNQRGIRKDVIELAIAFGDTEGDRCVLGRDQLKTLISSLDQLRSTALRAMDGGGLVVVEAGGSLITAFRADSFRRNAMHAN